MLSDTRQLIKFGDKTFGVSLPKMFTDELGWEHKDVLTVILEEDGVKIVKV